MIKGQFIKGGSLLGMSPLTTHMDPAAFGEDAKLFKPERWLGPDRGSLEKYFLGFGGGARICLGRNISQVEVRPNLRTPR